MGPSRSGGPGKGHAAVQQAPASTRGRNRRQVVHQARAWDGSATGQGRSKPPARPRRAGRPSPVWPDRAGLPRQFEDSQGGHRLGDRADLGDRIDGEGDFLLAVLCIAVAGAEGIGLPRPRSAPRRRSPGHRSGRQGSVRWAWAKEDSVHDGRCLRDATWSLVRRGPATKALIDRARSAGRPLLIIIVAHLALLPGNDGGRACRCLALP